MTREEMLQLMVDFDDDIGLAVQFVARNHPSDLELCYEIVAEIRGKR